MNSLLDNKILDSSKLRAFASDKINLNEVLKFNLGPVENIIGKGENAGYHVLAAQAGLGLRFLQID